MGEDFKRSRRFGLIGVFVVGIASAAIALAFGSDSANPTGVLVAVLALVFGFVTLLFILQRRDTDRAAAKARGAVFAAAAPVDDPTTVETDALFAALAVKPIDQAAVAAARERTWGTARGSINSAAAMTALIFCAVVPWILFQFAWSLVVFVPIILGYAIYLAVSAIGSGGTLDTAYEDSAATLEPLGLRMVERPAVVIRKRFGGPGAQADMVGALVYRGERHGRPVEVTLEGSDATVALRVAVEKFEVAVKGERLRAAEGAAPAVAAALEPLRASSYWRGLSVKGGAEGIVVERKRDGGLHWMRDLWLAERLADSVDNG